MKSFSLRLKHIEKRYMISTPDPKEIIVKNDAEPIMNIEVIEL